MFAKSWPKAYFLPWINSFVKNLVLSIKPRLHIFWPILSKEHLRTLNDINPHVWYRIYLVLGIFRWNVSRFCMLLELGMQVSIIQNPLSFHQKSVNSVCCWFYGLIKLYTEITYIWKMRPKIVKKCMSANSVCCLFILSNKHHTETT